MRRSAGLRTGWASVGVLVLALLWGLSLWLAAEEPRREVVDRLAVRSVSEVLRLRAAGQAGVDAIAMSGFWSDAMVPHSCALMAAEEQPAGIDMCRRGEYGFTERNEPAMVIEPSGLVTSEAEGPFIQPWLIHPAAASVLYTPGMVGPGEEPVPVVVFGHFNDPRALDCPVAARAGCLDGFVVDAVASVRGENRIPNLADRTLFEHGPLEPDFRALGRILDDVQGPDEQLLAAGVADGWNGSLFDGRIRLRLDGPTWFMTFLAPDGGIRTVGVDERSHDVVWPPST